MEPQKRGPGRQRKIPVKRKGEDEETIGRPYDCNPTRHPGDKGTHYFRIRATLHLITCKANFTFGEVWVMKSGLLLR